jgi:enoyl-[acyl-carrier protein] reductase I
MIKIRRIQGASRQVLADAFVSNSSTQALSKTMRFFYRTELFKPGTSIITLSYLGSELPMPNYKIMGVAEATLETSERYLEAELSPEKNVRVNSISSGPIRTLASSAIDGILDIIHNVEAKALLRCRLTEEVGGSTVAFLSSLLASGITGLVTYVDGAYCITRM